MQTPPPGPELVLARELSRFDYDDPSARRAASRGELVRIRRGIYVARAEWEALTPREKYRAVVRGYALSRREQPILSHDSAAVLWGLPHTGPQPGVVHVANSDPDAGRGRVGVRSHLLRLEPDDVTTIDGVRVTSLRRTVIDIAAGSSVMTAVASVDHVLYVDRRGIARAGITKDELRSALEAAMPMRGSVRARARIEFGETGAANGGESASRVTLAHIGAPAPVLQQTFITELGEFDTDFYFVDEDTAAELDGKQKYLDPAFRSGRTADRVVYDEKLREDAIRRRVRAFVRWPVSTGTDRDALRAILVAAGVPVGLPRPRLS